MPRCTNCGARADEDERLCDRCGTALPDSRGENTPGTAGGDGPDETAGEGDRVRDADRRFESGHSTGAVPEPSAGRTAESTDSARAVSGRSGGHTGSNSKTDRVPPPEHESGFAFVLGHPLRNGRRSLLLSALLLLGTPLVIPALVLAGYGYRLGRSAVFAAAEPPAYEDWGGLLMDGARLVIVVSIPTLLWGLGTALLLALLLLVVPSDSGALSVVVLGSLAGLLWFVGTYVVAFLGSDSAVTALRGDRRSLLRSDRGYIKHWVAVLVGTAILLAGLGAALTALLAVQGGLPGPLGPAVSGLWLVGVAVALAYALLAGATHAGYVYYTLADRGLVPPPEENVGMSPGTASLGTDG